MALKILLADDSMTAQNMGKKILVDAGYDVIAVSNGAAAIKKIASDRPDIVILDVYMPGYSGDEVCERVKGSPETAQIPVLLTVGKMEPFNPEKANRAKADGVMIKPFEATDLLAAVEAMSARKPLGQPAVPHIPTQKIESPAHEKTLRIPPPIVSLVDTLRVPPPVMKPEATPHTFDDTLPVAPPAAPAIDHNSTIRLTADQIRALQDASYKEWMTANQSPSESPGHEETMRISPPVHRLVAEATPFEMPVAPPPAAYEEPEAATPIPAFSASSMEHPAAIFEPETPEMQVTTVYQPHVPAQEEPASPTPFFGVTEPEPVELPTAPLIEPAPVVDYTQAAMVEPTPLFFAPGPVAVSDTPVLETNPPAAPEFAFIAPLEELETQGPIVHEVIAEAAPDLEINSPIHLQDLASVAAEPALVTNEDDMSEFTTRFGAEKAEEISVGVVSELTPEQIAAVSMPQEASPAFEAPPPPIIEEPMVSLVSEVPSVDRLAPEAEVVSEQAEEIAFVPEFANTIKSGEAGVQVQAPEPPAFEPAVAAAPVEEAVSAPVIEVLEPRADMEGPSTDDSLRRNEAEVQLVAGEETGGAYGFVAPEPERVFVRMDFQPDEDAHEIIEPDVAAAPEVVEPEPVEAVSATPQMEETKGPTPFVEASVAAAAAAAVGIGAAYVAHEAPSPEVERISVAMEPADIEAPEVEEHAAVAEAAVERHTEPMGDAELAEQLAAALAHSEAQDRARAAVEAAASSAIESAVAAAVEPVAAMSETPGWTDAKLAEAISRAIEHLKPQLIQEIVTELMKK